MPAEIVEVKHDVGSAATAQFAGRRIASASGRIWVAYRRPDSGVNQIFVAYSDDAGATWTEEKPNQPNRAQLRPSLAIDTAGYVHLAWLDTDGGSGFALLHAMRTAGDWQPYTSLDRSSDGVDLAPGLSGDIHAIWSGSTSLYYARWAGSWSSVETVESAACSNATCCVDTAGTLHAAWNMWAPTRSELHYCTKSSGTWSPINVWLTGRQYNALLPVLTEDRTGHVHCASWQATTNYGYILYREYDGAIWGSWVTLGSKLYYSMGAHGIGLTVDASGNPSVAVSLYGWQPPSSRWMLEYWHRSGGIWGAMEHITSDAWNVYYVSGDRRMDNHVITRDCAAVYGLYDVQLVRFEAEARPFMHCYFFG